LFRSGKLRLFLLRDMVPAFLFDFFNSHLRGPFYYSGVQIEQYPRAPEFLSGECSQYDRARVRMIFESPTTRTPVPSWAN